jgi:hypothetical protein
VTDRDIVMALVLYHYRRRRLCLGIGLVRAGLNTGKTRWLPEAERELILRERDAGIVPPSHSGGGYLGLIRCPAMWGLFISQGSDPLSRRHGSGPRRQLGR